jgi:hypothetical protein
MNEQKKVLAIAIGIFVLIAIVGTLLYFTVLKKPSPAPAEAAPPAESLTPPAAESAPAAGGETAVALPPVSLDQSDPVLRDYAGALSPNGLFAKWLQSKNLVRTFVVIVDNIANGQSPKANVDFFSPEGKFKVVFKPGGTFIDETSYARYDPVAEVVSSVDPSAAAGLYRGAKPLIQEAYRDLGYPKADFNDTLLKAMQELLETPVVEGPILVESKVLSFAMADESLENLSPAQKQLLRMGPKNVRAIQAKIREIAAALGFPASRLPETKIVHKPAGRP